MMTGKSSTCLGVVPSRTFVLIDATGKITFTHTGEGGSTESLLRAEIAKLGSAVCFAFQGCKNYDF